MTRPLSPDLPFYDTSIGTHRMFGGTAIYTADADNPAAPISYSEDGINSYEEGPAYQPRRNWTLSPSAIRRSRPQGAFTSAQRQCS